MFCKQDLTVLKGIRKFTKGKKSNGGQLKEQNPRAGEWGGTQGLRETQSHGGELGQLYHCKGRKGRVFVYRCTNTGRFGV